MKNRLPVRKRINRNQYIGAWFKALRLAKQLRQRAVAKRLNITQMALSHWELGDYGIVVNDHQVAVFAELYDITPAHIHRAVSGWPDFTVPMRRLNSQLTEYEFVEAMHCTRFYRSYTHG